MSVKVKSSNENVNDLCKMLMKNDFFSKKLLQEPHLFESYWLWK